MTLFDVGLSSHETTQMPKASRLVRLWLAQVHRHQHRQGHRFQHRHHTCRGADTVVTPGRINVGPNGWFIMIIATTMVNWMLNQDQGWRKVISCYIMAIDKVWFWLTVKNGWLKSQLRIGMGRGPTETGIRAAYERIYPWGKQVASLTSSHLAAAASAVPSRYPAESAKDAPGLIWFSSSIRGVGS